MANYALRVPDSLFGYVRTVAAEDQVSMNQFFVTAIAEKISAMKTVEYFQTRRERGNLDAFDAFMARVPNVPPMAGDEI